MKSSYRWLWFYPRSSAKIRGKAVGRMLLRRAFRGSYFGRAGAGHSGWQVPTGPPPGPKQQPHGRLQMSPVVHELPHALTAYVPVRNWRRDIALAERTPINIVANKILLAIVRSPFLDQFSLPVGAVGRPAGKSLRCRKGYSKSTAFRR